jgi:hypothetical protein
LEVAGIPSELAYTGAKSTIKHIVSNNFPRGVEWGKLTKAEQKRAMTQVKDAFRNGAELDEQWLADKISNSMSQARYHDRRKIRAYLKPLEDYRELSRPAQFSEDIWKAFYKVEVQIKATNDLVAAQEKLAKAKRAKEAGKSDRDLKPLEQKVNQMQKVVEEEGEPPKKFLQAAARVSLRPKTTHRMGQGGLPGLKAAFVSALPSSLDSFPLL